jgi:hypothetical protein
VRDLPLVVSKARVVEVEDLAYQRHIISLVETQMVVPVSSSLPTQHKYLKT